MKKIFLGLILSILSFQNSKAQVSTISGIINTYTSATLFPGCALCTSCNSVQVSNPSGFAIGNKILVIQMKGASINLNNSSTFGMVAAYGNAGFYDFSTIVGIAGNQFTLSPSLSNLYDPSENVQVIRVPVYNNAIVQGTLTAQTWNGITGGVIAFDVLNTLTLAGNINASGVGFRGGLSTSNGFSYPIGLLDYYYGGTIQDNAAQKGEGITVTIPGFELGRGAWANGGGGGNSHNGGGGGGSNAGPGGTGGFSYNTTNTPSGGRGGVTMDYSTMSRIFMGGGGGAGHSNNNVGTNGGAGGGIILIKANQIEGNSNFIIANGANANNTPGTGNDGAGGGGGGGSIVLFVPNLNNVKLQAMGGKGGNMTFTSGGHAPGAGGGGGFVAVQPTSLPFGVTSSVTGGANGIVSIDNTNFGALPGSDGQLLFNKAFITPPGLQIIQSNLGSDVVLCNPASVTLDAGVYGSNFTYEWYRNNALVSISTSPSYFVNAPGNYKVRVSASGCLAGTDSLNVSTQGASPANASFCAPPSQLVTLSVSGTGRYKWWTTSIGGSAIATGPVYTSTLSTSSIFYVQDTATFSYGNFTPSARLTGFNVRTGGSNTYMGFNAVRAFRIDSVNLFIRTYNTTNDFMTVRLRQRGNATPLATKDLGVTGPCNCQTDRNVQFYLGFDVPVGNQYYMEYSTGSVNVHWDQTTASYPYQVPGIISIYGPVDQNGAPTLGWAPSSYGFFYNWKISAGIACARVPVAATLNCPLSTQNLRINGTKEGESIFVLEWNDISGNQSVIHYEIEEAHYGQEFVKINQISHSKGTKSYRLPISISTHAVSRAFRVKAVMSDGSEVKSNILVENFSVPFQLQIVPNPFNDQIKISIVGELDGIVGKTEVFNTTGQLIYSDILDKSESIVNTQQWSSGVYIIKNQFDQTVQTAKLVKE